MSARLDGLIIKGIGGFYYVEAAGSVYECRARGLFRLQEITPTVGDRCVIQLEDGGSAVVDEILERKNILVRPPVANLDKLFVVVSTCCPSPNTFIIDRVAAAAEYASIEPVIVITKADISAGDRIREIYGKTGYRVITVDYRDNSGIEEVKAELKGCVSAFAGNSGVGKSTLLNAIDPALSQETAVISEKLGRGRHTTRRVELFSLPFGGRIADTPGFSSFDGELGAPIEKDQLELCFREFADYTGRCMFSSSCAHVKEKGCAVLAAVKAGVISKSRHDSYAAMYEEAKNIKPWDKKQ